ncbi:MAG TPA: trigger factor [Sphingobacteriaceae bacterium]|nr:trigger factor [Sphingobacteriaceae bacterium]
MNISQENIDDLNAVISIDITPEDYKTVVEDAMKTQAKKANIPGFRSGKVPVSHIKRMYGKSILLDEINRLVSDSLNNYLTENKIEILGQPLPKEEDKDKEYNWDFNDEFKFNYEIGLTPKIEVPFSEETALTEYVIKADEETLKTRISHLRKSYGKRTNPEVSEDGDMVFGDLKQLDAEGKVMEEGINVSSALRIDLVEDKKIKKSLIGLKKDDVLVVDIKKAYNNDVIAKLLSITEEEAEQLESSFELTVKNVNRLEEAELNKEFFDKVFGEDVIKTEEEFENRVTEEVEGMFVQTADQKLQNDIYTLGMDAVKVDFPDEFLKRWLKATNENLSDAEIEEGYEDFKKNLKWTLIENRIIADNSLEIKYEEVFQTAKDRLASQLQLYGQQSFTEEQLGQYAAQLLQDKEQANRIFDEVKALKVFDFIKGKAKLEKKEIGNDEFLKLK